MRWPWQKPADIRLYGKVTMAGGEFTVIDVIVMHTADGHALEFRAIPTKAYERSIRL